MIKRCFQVIGNSEAESAHTRTESKEIVSERGGKPPPRKRPDVSTSRQALCQKSATTDAARGQSTATGAARGRSTGRTITAFYFLGGKQ